MHMLKRVFFLLVFDWKHGEIVEVIIVFISSLYDIQFGLLLVKYMERQKEWEVEAENENSWIW